MQLAELGTDAIIRVCGVRVNPLELRDDFGITTHLF